MELVDKMKVSIEMSRAQWEIVANQLSWDQATEIFDASVRKGDTVTIDSSAVGDSTWNAMVDAIWPCGKVRTSTRSQ